MYTHASVKCRNFCRRSHPAPSTRISLLKYKLSLPLSLSVPQSRCHCQRRVAPPALLIRRVPFVGLVIYRDSSPPRQREIFLCKYRRGRDKFDSPARGRRQEEDGTIRKLTKVFSPLSFLLVCIVFAHVCIGRICSKLKK